MLGQSVSEGEAERTDSHRPEGSRSSLLPDKRSGEALALLLFEPLPIAGGSGAELPFLQAILDPGHEARWETWAEIHPESAEKLGIADLDWVRVAAQHGSIVVQARVGPRVVPGVVAIPVGQGKKAGGRWARGVGANPMLLVSPARDVLCGLPDLGATTVRVSRVAGVGDSGQSAGRS